jgi:hypothetical protein
MVLLQFDIIESPEGTSQEPIPVFGRSGTASQEQEAEVEVVLSFAEDIMPFALDSKLMVQWIFSVRV